MSIRDLYIERMIELFLAYLDSSGSFEAFEEVRFRASQLGKRLFKEKVPLDWIVGLYIEATRRLESEAQEEDLDLLGCQALLLEMVMTYSINLLKTRELEEQLQESNEKFKGIINSSCDIICTAEKSGKWTFINQAAKKILGYEPADMVGRPSFDFIFPEDVKSAREAHESVVGEGKSLREHVNKWISKDGGTITLSWNIVPLRNRRGQIVGTHGVGRDITSRDKLEQRTRIELDCSSEG
jgi:PAS domain S-box-containing protein